MRTLSTVCGAGVLLLGLLGQALAQQPFLPPTVEMLSAGVVDASSSVLSMEVQSPFSDGISEKNVFDVLNHVQADDRRSRGPRDIALFKALAPSVVLISTTKELGSGSVIAGRGAASALIRRHPNRVELASGRIDGCLRSTEAEASEQQHHPIRRGC
jgi:hypothetical protein